MTMASILFWCMRARARSRRRSRSVRVMGTASVRRLVRAAIAGGRFSGWALSTRADCAAAVRTGDAAAAAAEVRRKRRRLSMGATSVLGKIRTRCCLRKKCRCVAAGWLSGVHFLNRSLHVEFGAGLADGVVGEFGGVGSRVFLAEAIGSEGVALLGILRERRWLVA